MTDPTTQQHTPEPWRRDGMHINVGENGRIGTAYHTIAGVSAYDNGNRIVACVNACSGMADPAREIAELRCDQDAAVARLQLPDGSVPTNTLDAAMKWRGEYGRMQKDAEVIRRELAEVKAELAALEESDELRIRKQLREAVRVLGEAYYATLLNLPSFSASVDAIGANPIAGAAVRQAREATMPAAVRAAEGGSK